MYTHFGLFVKINKQREGKINIPKGWRRRLEGLCGNYDGFPWNDWTTPDKKMLHTNDDTGIVHDYDGNVPQFDYSDVSDEETELGRSWALHAPTGRKRRSTQNWTLGATTAEIDAAINGCSPRMKARCANLFQDDSMANCREKVDVATLVETCTVDYCLLNSEEVIEDYYTNFFEDCAETLPENDAVCNWRTDLGLPDICDAGMVWSGCKSECDALKTCGSVECDADAQLSGCFCPEGKVLDSNGDCIDENQCGAESCVDDKCINDEVFNGAANKIRQARNYRKCAKKQIRKLAKKLSAAKKAELEQPLGGAANCAYEVCDLKYFTKGEYKKCYRGNFKQLKKESKKNKKSG